MKINLKNVKKVAIVGEYIKLDALLKFITLAGTGGEAKYHILRGAVSVCGEVCLQRGRKIKPGDTVRYENMVYLITKKDGG